MTTIQDAQKLIEVFGIWPSFHDAEVLSIRLDRGGPDGPTLELRIHVFEATSEVDAAGYYVLRNHTEVTLRFADVALDALSGFNQQNVIFELEVSTVDALLHDGRSMSVALTPSFGVEAEFFCSTAWVTDVRPYSRDP